jgi:hypothetical protein
MCDVPKSLAGWENRAVRWRGVLLDADPHGLTLIAEDCRRRGITIQQWPSDSALARVRERSWREPGVIRVDVSGLITSARVLSVSQVHSIEFQPMSAQQKKEWWRSKGF